MSAASDIARNNYGYGIVDSMVKEYFAIAAEGIIANTQFSSMSEALNVIRAIKALPLGPYVLCPFLIRVLFPHNIIQNSYSIGVCYIIEIGSLEY